MTCLLEVSPPSRRQEKGPTANLKKTKGLILLLFLYRILTLALPPFLMSTPSVISV